MPVKLSDLTTESSPASTDIIGIADPSTGVMRKITVSALKTYMDTLGGGGGSAPTVVSATCPNGAANTVVVVFSQSMTAVTTAGWSFKKNGSAWSVSSVTGSGTTWTFTMGSSAASGDTLLRSYDSTTGATIGTSLELVSFTDSAVTNNVAASFLHRSLFTASNATALISYTPDNGSAWTHAEGTFEIQSNKVQPLTYAASNATAVTDVGQNTYTISAKMTKGTSGVVSYYSIVLRYTDLNNFIKITLTTDTLYCYKTVAGTTTQVGSSVVVGALDDTTEHTYEIVVSASQFDLTVDGTLRFDNYAIDAALTGNKVGITYNNAGGGIVKYDDYTVTS